MSSDEWASDMVRSSIIMWLYEQPLHGYAIISNLKTRLKRNVSPSLVYPFLRQLEQKGFLKSTVESVGQKPRKVYELTEEGLQLASVLFKRLASLVSIAIEPSLDVCAHCGAKIFEGGHKTLVRGTEMMFCCVHCFHAYERERE
ncbi:MAG: PadR family transcriptional regulator [Candidatus Bathyarchaeota archaeon]|jgi:DNA-binding PadR family transcriptional regulator|nr:PadR family transcriptional regulator [Candidatus Bathyarchaeota archaeon]